MECVTHGDHASNLNFKKKIAYFFHENIFNDEKMMIMSPISNVYQIHVFFLQKKSMGYSNFLLSNLSMDDLVT